jgi:hypothetical protein
MLALMPMSFWQAMAGQSHTHEVEAGDCLLASRSHLSRPQASIRSDEALNQQRSRRRSWSEEHHRLFKVANDTTDSLDQFIRAQNRFVSSDHCSARLMESKRALDGLLKDLASISKQVESHEEVLATETENLNITHKSIDAVESTFEEDKAACEKLKQDAEDDFNTFSNELEELKQIANPAVRYTHAVSVNIPLANQSATALLGTATWSQTQCSTFVNFTLHSVVGKTAAAKNLTCDEQRGELQKVYTETYLAVRDLIKDAQERIQDKSCMDTAEAKRTSEIVPLTSQRETAAGRIEYSTQALAMLEPVLHMLERRVEKLEQHIKLTLTPECQEAAKVSSTIKVIRDLIISLEKCPGRNDFRLQIPPENKTSTKTAAPELLQVTNNESTKLKPKIVVITDKPREKSVNATTSADSHEVNLHHYHRDSDAKKAEVRDMHQKEAEASEGERDEDDNEDQDDDYDDDSDDGEGNASNNDDEEEYDEIQTRVETKSTPNGTVTTYVDEQVESDDENDNESQ